MEIKEEFVSAACNCTYNCLELQSDFIIYGANKAVAVYNIQEASVVQNIVSHKSRINCIRFLKNTEDEWILSSDSDGQLVLWRFHKNKLFISEILREGDNSCSITVCDGIRITESEAMIGYLTSFSKVFICRHSYPFTSEKSLTILDVVQEIDLKNSIALDLVFHLLESIETTIIALGMDYGSVNLFGYSKKENPETIYEICSLKKHDDWVRCIAFTSPESGMTLMATGGEDSFIAIWRFIEPTGKNLNDKFEFQIKEFQNCKIYFDSMIMGHEGWINSLDWNSKGELISCSSDQSIIIWQNSGDIWTEKFRFGTVGGQTPGGFGAKIFDSTLAAWGFQGSIQIWKEKDDEWKVTPSITGHFNSVTDLDYHRDGNFLVSSSHDQTSRIFAPWGKNRWHEIARPQIHGHDIFAITFCQDFLISGAEEKILRAFQPTEIFIHSLETTSEVSVCFGQFSSSASVPALGLSNQSGLSDVNSSSNYSTKSNETMLDEDFLRANTLWPEISKLYGHVFEIACIATSRNYPLIASASQSSKPQFSGIILWCSTTWKNLGDYKFHKLNVNGLEFNEEGSRLLSVSRDRTWALWKVFECPSTSLFSMEILESGGVHTRALLVGTWVPLLPVFATGARDKKLIVWKPSDETNKRKFEPATTCTFKHSVSAISINEDCILAAGLESGCLFLFKLSLDLSGEGVLQLLLKLENSSAHHGSINRLKFNPINKNQLASAGSDHLVKIFQLTALAS